MQQQPITFLLTADIKNTFILMRRWTLLFSAVCLYTRIMGWAAAPHPETVKLFSSQRFMSASKLIITQLKAWRNAQFLLINMTEMSILMVYVGGIDQPENLSKMLSF